MVKEASEALLAKASEHPVMFVVVLVFFVSSSIHSLTLGAEILTVMSNHIRREIHHLVEAGRHLGNEVKEWWPKD